MVQSHFETILVTRYDEDRYSQDKLYICSVSVLLNNAAARHYSS